MKKIVEIKNISKSFGDNVVLDNINLDIYDNEFITLLGPSGCGKTTLLRIIGGFEVPDQGDVIFMGENINGLPPHKRNVNTVFLLPAGEEGAEGRDPEGRDRHALARGAQGL